MESVPRCTTLFSFINKCHPICFCKSIIRRRFAFRVLSSASIERGLNIKYMKFRLPAEGKLEESDIEIPLDEYRSYKRTKRSAKDTAK